jgi:hypothetical protein
MKLVGILCAAAPMVLGDAVAGEPPAPWEVTVGASGKRSDEGWRTASPEGEVKYQWSDRLELGVKLNWESLRPAGAPAASALSAAEFAYKYRFIDAGDAGVDVAFAPALTTRLTRASVRRGIASDSKELLVGLETTYASARLEVEVKSGWNFVEGAPGQLAFEVKTTYQCAARLFCVFVGERKFGPGEKQTGAKLELDVALTPALLLKGGLGREVGPYDPGQENRVLSLALQSTF